MDDTHKTVLQANHVLLCENVEPRGGVLDSLYEDGIFTDNDVEEIVSSNTRRGRCQSLLRMLPTRGPLAFNAFMKALKRGALCHVVEMLPGANENITENNPPFLHKCTKRYRCEKCELFWDKAKHKKMKANRISKFLEKYACLFLNNLDPKYITDQLFQDGIVSNDDIETITSGVTRLKRCETMLMILLCKSSTHVIASLLTAMRKKFQFIVDAVGEQCTDEKHEDTITPLVANTAELEVQRNRDPRSCQCFHKTTPSSDKHFNTGTGLNVPMQEQCEYSQTNPQTVQSVPEVHYDNVNLSKSTPSVEQNQKCSFSKADTRVTKSRTSIQSRKQSRNKTKSLEVTRVVANPRQAQGNTYAVDETVSMSVSSLLTGGQSMKIVNAFNLLSSLINEGEYHKFDCKSTEILRRYSENKDMSFIIGYLNISRYLFQSDFDRAKKHIKASIKLVPNTKNPQYSTIEILSTKTRLYLLQRKLGKIENYLDYAKMLIETDPVGLSGRAAGWIYLNDGRSIAAKMTCLNLGKHTAMKVYNKLFIRAQASLKRSMEHFRMEPGKDGPFGFAYALTRLVILLMRCGDNGRTIGLIQPTPDDLSCAATSLQNLEESDIPIVKMLKINYCLAKCDYMYRRDCISAAKEHAQTAYDLASDLGVLEFVDHANNRLMYLSTCHARTARVRELSEDEVHQILFNSSESSRHVSERSSNT